MKTNPDIRNLADEILQSRKYRGLGIPIETVMDLLQQELKRHISQKQVLRVVRRKLHQIMAPYLGDLDYAQARQQLEGAFQTQDEVKIRLLCRDLLSQHISTHERLPNLSGFYENIFQRVGKPQTILDLACGLNPLALPWMNLPEDIQYHAYDIHKPRIELINRFFELSGLEPLAEVRDVLLTTPNQRADVAFLLKEPHRLELRRRGSNRELWAALNVSYLIISLPRYGLSSKFNLTEKIHKLVYGITDNYSWQIEESLFNDEIVFCIEK
ncbi:MAG TPA: hypothetical protein G4N92_06990 [Anaerolineae bacterium]|nr:hypothetical protein [Anaerolineae bacterium]